MRISIVASIVACAPLAFAETSGLPPTPAGEPPILPFDPADFIEPVENPYFPLRPGTIYLYKSVTPDGIEINQVAVTSGRKTIQGVSTIVVRDRVFLDGQLTEDTFDWYAPDRFGNVWYFGEDSKAFEDGVLVSTAGSWESGKHDAHAGIVMEAHPQVGDVYRQEFQAGEAEDMAKVVSLNKSVRVPSGWAATFPNGIFNYTGSRFENVVKTRDFTPLEPTAVEWKYYAPGVGQVYGVEHDGSDVIITRLIGVFGP